MRTPHPNAIAYEVTARAPGLGGAPFHMCGHDFPLGETVRVEAAALTPARREYLLNAEPRDLVVVELLADTDLPEEGAEAAAPAVDAPTDDATAGDEPSDAPAGGDADDGKDDEEPGDDAPAEGAASATSAPSPAPSRKKKGKRR